MQALSLELRTREFWIIKRRRFQRIIKEQLHEVGGLSGHQSSKLPSRESGASPEDPGQAWHPFGSPRYVPEFTLSPARPLILLQDLESCAHFVTPVNEKIALLKDDEQVPNRLQHAIWNKETLT